jgi:hypothetical protein
MADLLYCGAPPVSPENTVGLVEGPFNAVWAPPMGLNVPFTADDQLWLVWRRSRGEPALLLARGTLLGKPSGGVTWTNRTAPGIRDAAMKVGYGGPTNMAFLRLGDVRVFRPHRPVAELSNLSTGLSAATPEQISALQAVASTV